MRPAFVAVGLILGGLVPLVSLTAAVEAPWVLLRSVPSGPVAVEGDASLLDQAFPPASNFKIVLAAVALEEGVIRPATRKQVSDAYIPDTPRRMDLTEALYFSSNDYFAALGRELGQNRIEKFLLRTRWYGPELPSHWLDEGWAAVAHGGGLRITPRQNHEIMRSVLSGNWTQSAQAAGELRQVLCWPTNNPELKPHGKSGVWGGSVWFNGFVEKPEGAEIVTVFVRGSLPERDGAIERCYRAFGLSWAECRRIKQ